jgi:manganese/zinc/iron transport system permease protein
MTLHGLSAAHADPAYPSERGMIDAFHGTASQRTLARLEAQGLVRSVTHPPETTAHWELTDAGRDSAQDTLRRLSPADTAPGGKQ